MELRGRIGFVGLAVVIVAVAFIAVWRAGTGPRTAAVTSGDAARGARLYETLPCASCHDISHP